MGFQFDDFSRKKKKSKPIPFDFVLDQLADLDPKTKPMFGCTAIYIESKIIFILRDKEGANQDNGIWIATTKEHHESLKKEFPSMRSISVFGTEVTSWQLLPSDSSDFEYSALRACELVLLKDARIGKHPSKKTKKKPISKRKIKR